MSTKVIIAGIMDIVGKVVVLVGATIIHPGLGLMYGGYVITTTAHEAVHHYQTMALKADAEAQLDKLQDILGRSRSLGEKEETRH